jgi:excisionase family DNA binding protein
MAQEMMKTTTLTPSGSVPTPPPLPGAPAAGVEVLTPAQVAQSLGVTEQDVLASLEAGDIKGKKIGSAWRVTKAALDEFLAK